MQGVERHFNYGVFRLAMDLRSASNHTLAVVHFSIEPAPGNRQTLEQAFYQAMIR